MEGLSSNPHLSSHQQTKQQKTLRVKRSILQTTRLLLPTIVFFFAVLTTTEARKSHTEKRSNYKKYKTERKTKTTASRSGKTKHYSTKTTTNRTTAESGSEATKFELFNNAGAEVSEFRRSVIAYAESFLGIQYVLGGTGNGKFDCSGFVRYVLNNFSVDLTTTAHQQCQMGERIPLAFVRPGDLVFFGTKDWISHVGMVYSYDETGLTIIHCATSKGVAKENISKSNYWLRRIQYASNIIGM